MNMLASSSGLNFNETTQSHNPEDHSQNNSHHKSSKLVPQSFPGRAVSTDEVATTCLRIITEVTKLNSLTVL
jgi:hypothetical protein